MAQQFGVDDVNGTLLNLLFSTLFSLLFEISARLRVSFLDPFRLICFRCMQRLYLGGYLFFLFAS